MITRNGKWISGIPGITGWIKSDVIFRMSISTYTSSSIVNVNIFFQAGDTDYWSVRVPNVEAGNILIDEILEVIQ